MDLFYVLTCNSLIIAQINAFIDDAIVGLLSLPHCFVYPLKEGYSIARPPRTRFIAKAEIILHQSNYNLNELALCYQIDAEPTKLQIRKKVLNAFVGKPESSSPMHFF